MRSGHPFPLPKLIFVERFRPRRSDPVCQNQCYPCVTHLLPICYPRVGQNVHFGCLLTPSCIPHLVFLGLGWGNKCNQPSLRMTDLPCRVILCNVFIQHAWVAPLYSSHVSFFGQSQGCWDAKVQLSYERGCNKYNFIRAHISTSETDICCATSAPEVRPRLPKSVLPVCYPYVTHLLPTCWLKCLVWLLTTHVLTHSLGFPGAWLGQ